MRIRRSSFAISIAFSSALCLAGAEFVAPARAQAPASPQPAVAVGSVLADRRPITKATDFVGRVEAMEKVEIRARVTGFIESVLFKEGDKVAVGAPLYVIEKDPFAAAVQQAEGALIKAKGQLANATAQRERAEQLLRTQSGSAATRDQRVAEEETARGDVAVGEANLQTAKINLGYTEIAAPITGVIGRTSRTKGNVVGPDSGVLATIVSQDPMYVVFPVSQREFLTLAAKERGAAAGALKVRIKFSDGSVYPHEGRINFIDVTVDKSTDTVTVRAALPNPDGLLIDGQLVRVAVEGEKAKEAILVPQTALIADQQGVYVFVVEDGKAVVRRVKPAGEVGPEAIIESGLSGGEQVIVEGTERVRPGAAVTVRPAAPVAGRS